MWCRIHIHSLWMLVKFIWSKYTVECRLYIRTVNQDPNFTIFKKKFVKRKTFFFKSDRIFIISALDFNSLSQFSKKLLYYFFKNYSPIKIQGRGEKVTFTTFLFVSEKIFWIRHFWLLLLYFWSKVCYVPRRILFTFTF